MSDAFVPGQTLDHNGLPVVILDENAQLVDPSVITYSVYKVERMGMTPLLQDQVPLRYSLGWWYAPLTIEDEWPDGEYHLVYKFNVTSTSPLVQIVNRFFVYKSPIVPGTFDEKVFRLVGKLRTLLRDNNPDRNYHFRPPRHAEEVNAYTQRVGYIWEDAELAEFLDMGLSMVNLSPPGTSYTPQTLPMAWETPLLYGAASAALLALTTNWIEEEFNYSIGGYSLDLQKSSKYQSLADTFDAKFDKLLDRGKKTEKYTQGLRQSSYSISVQGYVGPFVARGMITARSYIESSTTYL